MRYLNQQHLHPVMVHSLLVFEALMIDLKKFKNGLKYEKDLSMEVPNSLNSTFEVYSVEGHGLGCLIYRSALKKSKIFIPVNVTR